MENQGFRAGRASRKGLSHRVRSLHRVAFQSVYLAMHAKQLKNGVCKRGEFFPCAVGLKPLTEMAAADTYLGEDGGLYGGGQNQPPEK